MMTKEYSGNSVNSYICASQLHDLILTPWPRRTSFNISIPQKQCFRTQEAQRPDAAWDCGQSLYRILGLSPSIVQYAFFLFAIKPMAVWQHTVYTRT